MIISILTIVIILDYVYVNIYIDQNHQLLIFDKLNQLVILFYYYYYFYLIILMGLLQLYVSIQIDHYMIHII